MLTEMKHLAPERRVGIATATDFRSTAQTLRCRSG